MKKIISLIAIVLIAASTDISIATGQTPVNSRYGDINADGELDTFDLLYLLREMRSGDPLPAADLDSSGTVDVMDLLALLGEFKYQREVRSSDFEAMVTLDGNMADDPLIYLYRSFDQYSEIRCDYRISCNRKISRVEFVFGADTLTELTGNTPVLHSADFDTIGYFQPHSLEELYAESEEFHWWLKLWGRDGGLYADSGMVKVAVPRIGVSFFSSPANIGRPIAFPLVLRGRDMRLEIQHPEMDETTGESFGSYWIDLNEAGKDSVVFTDIVMLSEAIMEEIVANRELWSRDNIFHEPMRTYVTPAVEIVTGEKTKRLMVGTINALAGSYTAVKTVSNNEYLLKTLGFPEWYRQVTHHTRRYELDQDLVDKYQDQ